MARWTNLGIQHQSRWVNAGIVWGVFLVFPFYLSTGSCHWIIVFQDYKSVSKTQNNHKHRWCCHVQICWRMFGGHGDMHRFHKTTRLAGFRVPWCINMPTSHSIATGHTHLICRVITRWKLPEALPCHHLPFHFGVPRSSPSTPRMTSSSST